MTNHAPALIVLAAGIVALGLIISVMWRRERGFGPLSVKLVGLVFVAWIAALAYALGGGVPEGLMALLGTIAGYLIGHDDKTEQR